MKKPILESNQGLPTVRIGPTLLPQTAVSRESVSRRTPDHLHSSLHHYRHHLHRCPVLGPNIIVTSPITSQASAARPNSPPLYIRPEHIGSVYILFILASGDCFFVTLRIHSLELPAINTKSLQPIDPHSAPCRSLCFPCRACRRPASTPRASQSRASLAWLTHRH